LYNGKRSSSAATLLRSLPLFRGKRRQSSSGAVSSALFLHASHQAVAPVLPPACLKMLKYQAIHPVRSIGNGNPGQSVPARTGSLGMEQDGPRVLLRISRAIFKARMSSASCLGLSAIVSLYARPAGLHLVRRRLLSCHRT
jgi:hypothetical protein